MNFSTASKKNREIEQRIQRIVDLSRRRDQILGVAEVDLDALAILAADYEAAHLHRIAVELRIKLNWYQGRSGKRGREKVESDGAATTASRLPFLAFGSGNGKEVEAWASGVAVLNGRRGES
jgi:hypothetical protein